MLFFNENDHVVTAGGSTNKKEEDIWNCLIVFLLAFFVVDCE
jgi:hypothetical protein